MKIPSKIRAIPGWICGKPLLFIIPAALALVLYIISAMSKADFFYGEYLDPLSRMLHEDPFKRYISEVYYSAVSDSGAVAVNDKYLNGSVMLIEPSGDKLRYSIGLAKLDMGTESKHDLCFGENDTLYLHTVEWTGEYEGTISSEQIYEIQPDGKISGTVFGTDYTDSDDPPTRKPRLHGFAFFDDRLTFASVGRRSTVFYSFDTNSGAASITGKYSYDDKAIGSVFPLENGRYLCVLTNGDVCTLIPGEELSEPVYRFTVYEDDPDMTDIIMSACEIDGDIYVTAGYRQDTVYLLSDGELTPVCDMLKALSDGYGQDMTETDLYADTGFRVTDLDRKGDDLLISCTAEIFLFDPAGGTCTMMPSDIDMPSADKAAHILLIISNLLFYLAVAALIAFIASRAICRSSILFKQLLVILPTLTVIWAALFQLFASSFVDNAQHMLNNELVAVSELAAMSIDAGLVDAAVTHEDGALGINTEGLDALKSRLDEISCHNRGYWNSSFDFNICIPSGDMMYTLISSASDEFPYEKVIFGITDEDAASASLPGSNVLLFSDVSHDFRGSFINSGSDYCTIVPILRNDGSTAAFLVIETDLYAFNKMIFDLETTVLMILIATGALLTLIMIFLSMRISAVIQKATKAVTKIADGDFSTRIDNRSKDELGEICRQVNTMADSLEDMFEEKDKNERFYYKFVPEKFKDLLGKEKLTDLSLGDAESREFTVLFCDIRSFSINSEMLTAKENFEFVNIIYGIAGPIIRKHGGFVDKYIGDAVMALFESPDEAVAAGTELYHDIVLDPSTAEKLGISEINIGVGIHTGMARIGIVGEDERLSGTVISDTVNLSSRLESLTKTYHTAMLVSKDTIDRMSDPDSLNTRYLGMVQVAGVNEVKALYEVLDCLDEKRRNERMANRSDFREAIRLFHMGKRREAADLLAAVAADGRADEVTDLYQSYIRNLSDEDKGNVFRFVRK